VFGCKKDEDKSPPAIQIIYPSGGLPTYAYTSSLFIEFTAKDNEAIGEWIVTLKDEQGTTRYTSGTREVNSQPLEITKDVGLFFEDVRWPGGDYLISIEVRDASGNRNAAFKTIRYYEPPLARNALLVLSSNGGTSTLDSLSSNGVFSAINTYASDASIAFANSWHQEFILGGNNSPQICFSPFESLIETNCYVGFNPLSGNYTQDIAFDPNSLTYLTACFDGAIREFQRSGNLIRTIPISGNFVPEELFISSNRIVAEVRNEAQDLSVLYSLDRNSGALIQSLVCPGNVISLEKFGSNVLVAGTANGLPYVFYVDPESLSVTDLNWYVSDLPLKKMIRLTEGRFALAHADGVYMHIFATNQFVDGAANGINAIDLAFDPANNALFVLDESTLYQLNPASMSIVDSWPAPTGAIDIEVLLNK